MVAIPMRISPGDTDCMAVAILRRVSSGSKSGVPWKNIGIAQP